MRHYAYYNEWDPYAAQWLRNLMAKGLIMDGEVDTRSITEVQPEDLKGFTRVGFFAGIGGWDRALQLAGWPEDRPVWHGSPPCQPFSTAGKQLGVLDERHLAPHFLSLVAALRPAVLFGEQVSAAVNKDAWLDDLLDALEREGYATGAAVLPACGVGAPHIRQRLWFVAERMADTRGATGEWNPGGVPRAQEEVRCQNRCEHGDMPVRHKHGGADGRLADPLHPGRAERWAESGSGQVAGMRESGGVGDACGIGRQPLTPELREHGCGVEPPRREPVLRVETSCDVGGLANPNDTGLEGRFGVPERGDERPARAGGLGSQLDNGERPRKTHGLWDSPDWLFCRDGKWRPAQSGIEPLAHGVSNRVGRLRAYGNAIVPQAAAEIIRAYLAGAATR